MQITIGITHTHVNIESPVSLSLHACHPSDHVWSFEPGSPQFPYQVPPAAQQLREPDIMLIPHLGHTGPAAVVMGDIVSAAVVTGDVVSAAVVMGDVVSAAVVMGDVVSAVVVVGLQAWMPSDQE